jgi:chemotaxis protein methyltransferase CheR
MSPLGGNEVVLKPEEFRLLRDLISANMGLSFSPDMRFSIERRLRERLSVLGLRSFAEYYQHLRFHPMAHLEWDEVYDLLTTNETYFCREDYQLRAFKDELLPMLAEHTKGRRRLTIWSAGCSTGEEVYTCAILVHESGLFSGWDVRVYGSDISKRCIAAARRGVYGASSFRAMHPDMRRAYFVERADGSHVVERIRAVCHFGQMNLLDGERARLLGRADAVFCRNVLIYFDAHARRRVIDTLHERLYPGGVLLLGHSESLLNVTTAFELLHLKEDLVYRRPQTPSLSLDSRKGR